MLLGRKAAWPEGKWSTLAGFVEFGERLEECVCREVLEESGVEVDRSTLRHVASQPWPFPSSLMVGYACRAKTEAITVDDELEDVAWFDRAFVAKALRTRRRHTTNAGRLPRADERVLSRVLIEGWVQEQSDVPTVRRGHVPRRSAGRGFGQRLGPGLGARRGIRKGREARVYVVPGGRVRRRRRRRAVPEDGQDLAELDEPMARGPGEARIREAARSMLRELEARYDNTFDPVPTMPPRSGLVT